MVKYGLVISGGGFASVYGAGAMKALKDKYNFDPVVIVGGSGSSANIAYYASDQLGLIKDFWCNRLFKSDIISFLRLYRIFDVNKLITMLRTGLKLDVKALKKSNNKYYIATTNYDTGELTFFSNKDADLIYPILEASMRVPMACGGITKIKGQRYIDGGVAANLIDYLNQARKEKVDKIIILDTPFNSTGKTEKYFMKLYGLFKSKGLKKAIYYGLEGLIGEDRQKHLVDDENIFILTAKDLGIPFFTRDSKLMIEGYDKGYSETLKNKKLAKFLKG